MTLKNFFKNSGYVGLVVFTCLNLTNSLAQTTTFEFGQAQIDAYTTIPSMPNPNPFANNIIPGSRTPFTTITFDTPFASTPNVFTMTPEFAGADDPCTIRIENVTTVGFDVTCLEPLNEDRANPDMPFEYIAVQGNGDNPVMIDVPLADGSGDVTFVTNCQFIQPGEFSFNPPIRFNSFNPNIPPPFSSPPTVITQVQTTFAQAPFPNPQNEPIFLDVRVLGVTSSNIDVRLETAESSTQGFFTGERVCYLAAEANGCQSLDFSSLSESTDPVQFQALQTGNVVTGHDDGACASVAFENGCFNSTPVVLAKQTTSNDTADGGWLRRCSVSDSAASFIYDEDRVQDPERSHLNAEAISVFAFEQDDVTPVTLNSAKVSIFGRKAKFSWETSAETFHLGFNIWGETSDGWVQLNNRLIKGSGADTDQPQTYRQTRRLTRSQRKEITQFGISSVDSTGYEEFYGPFSEGQEYGEEANNESVDWTSTRTEFEQSMRERGFTKVNNRWLRLSDVRQARLEQRNLGINRTVFDLNIDGAGIHSISANDLIALNPNWDRIRLNRIALTLNGNAVSRHIISKDSRLSVDDRIVFNAREVTGQDTPFIENYTYRLVIDSSKSTDATTFDGSTTDSDELAEIALISEQLTSKKLHSAALTTGDPWYDARLLSVGSPTSTEYSAGFAYPINEEKEGRLDIVLFGSLDFPGDDDDHHVQIFVNDVQVHDVRFDGLVGYEQQISLPAGLLKTQNNTVVVTVVGDTGFFADVVLVDEIHLSAFSSLVDDQRSSFNFTHNEDALGYRLTSTTSSLAVFAYTASGVFSAVESTITEDGVQFTGLPFEASDNNHAELRYLVVNTEALPTPRISMTSGMDLHSEATDYLIVAHPSFIGDELDAFVEFKTELGYNVRVVDWLEIVNTYGHGNNTPSALNNFLSAANKLYSTDNVLIVGGHTFDFFGITNESIVNFIPSHYRPVSIFEYTATDNPYADLNGDNIPEIAIGRWPVRSIADLQVIISKTKDWHQNRQDDTYQSAYLLAQDTDGQNLSFSEQLDNNVRTPLLALEEIETINRLYLDGLPDDVTDIVGFTRSELAAQINGGTDLISFSGHASPTAWGFQNIINTSFVKDLENQGEPALLMPLACYITHYESVSTNTLAHQWLFAGEQGAAAIHGASVLGDYRENGLFAERYLRKSKVTNTLGQAVLKAKKELGSKNEVLHNWSLLGDPALPIR